MFAMVAYMYIAYMEIIFMLNIALCSTGWSVSCILTLARIGGVEVYLL